jgi:hypothetical protein
MRRRSSVFQWGWALLLVGFGLAPTVAWALPLVESVAEATAIEYGDDPGTDSESDQTSLPGNTAAANAHRCPGTGSFCVYDAELWDSIGARARARTDFGSNRARVATSELMDVDELASAASLWIDEWTFLVPLAAVGEPVSIELRLDGAWENDARVRFEAAVIDPTLPGLPPNSDDPPLFDLGGFPVAFVAFDNTEEYASTNVAPFLLPVDDGGKPDGSVDLTLTLRFVPVPLRTYLVVAALRLDAGYGGKADFSSTAAVTRVVVPAGVTFSSTGVYEVAVPEPGAALLLAAAAGALVLGNLCTARPVPDRWRFTG